MNLSNFTDVVHAAMIHDENTQISSQPTNPFPCHAEICVAAEICVHLAGARTAVTSALLQHRDIRNIVEYVIVEHIVTICCQQCLIQVASI